MQIIDLEQGSPEWHAFRLGKIGGTRLGSIWSSREYTKDDIEKLLKNRGVDLAAYKQERDAVKVAAGKKKGVLTKADLELLLTDEDKEQLSVDAEKKIEYYQILADQVAVAAEEEDDGKYLSQNGEFVRVMDRGTDLEAVAADRFALMFDKRLFSVGCCVSEEDGRVFNSPDRLVMPDKFKGNAIGTLIEKINAGKLKITEAVEIKCLASAKHLMAFFERKVPEEYWTQKVQYFAVNPHLKTLYWVFYDPRISMLPLFVLVIHREDLGHWPETMLKYQKRTMRELDALKIRLFEESDNIMLPAVAEKV